MLPRAGSGYCKGHDVWPWEKVGSEGCWNVCVVGDGEIICHGPLACAGKMMEDAVKPRAAAGLLML